MTGDVKTLAGVINVRHEVIYSWNEMDSTDRGLTAEEIYSLTVADDVDNGLIGNLSVSLCPECQPPRGIFAYNLNNLNGF